MAKLLNILWTANGEGVCGITYPQFEINKDRGTWYLEGQKRHGGKWYKIAVKSKAAGKLKAAHILTELERGR